MTTTPMVEHAARCPVRDGAACRCGATADRPIAVHAADCAIVLAGYARGVCCSCAATDGNGDRIAPQPHPASGIA